MELPSYLTATAKSKGVGQVNALEYDSTPSAGEGLRSRCRKRRISAANRTVIVGDQPKTIGFIAFGQEKRLPKGELVTRRRATPRLLTWTPSRLGNSAVLRAMSMAPVKAPRSSHVPTGHLLSDVTQPWGIGVATCPKESFPRMRESTGLELGLGQALGPRKTPGPPFSRE